MSERRRWSWILGGGAALLGFLAWGIHSARGRVEALTGDLGAMRGTLAAAHRTVEGLPQLERRVLIARAVAPAVERALPAEEDVHDLVHQLHMYSREAGVRITGYRRRADPPARRGQSRGAAVERAAYTFTLEAGAFQFLAFLERVENHPRFLAVPNLKLTAARRHGAGEAGPAWHRIQLDVETYRHGTETEAGSRAAIPDGERKHERLAEDMTERRLALAVDPVPYGGPAGRRDPWVDPRTPLVRPEATKIIELEREQGLAAELERRTQRLRRAWERVAGEEEASQGSELGARLILKAELDSIEGDFRRAQLDRSLTDTDTARRLENSVLAVLKGISREMIRNPEPDPGVAREELLALLALLRQRTGEGDWEAVLRAGRGAEPLLREARTRGQHTGLVEGVLRLSFGARTARDLAALELVISGIVCLRGGNSVALVNGQAVTVGDRLEREVTVCDIRPGAVEFEFRGVKLSRDL
ncbi:MAG TPA: hypothetical protein QF730_11010 [Planctomycetota bacterium]|jgi:hypothetical protein|nr:hypothetical protein [Planctomycetota bacterium]